ncbi:Holliday junction branch migration protein RuvA [Agaribacterium haliotis]|uniref:Holliday junction branch migration protein RuvA n=1 Tax=Agaribacterium haliotis TaxID=2013869 RepID=UPI000BB55CE2|nr:Holliday junction branch migration protein RuvA [Agaribacterium haliotis]
MIGRLRGCLLEKQAPYLLLECGGVGYELQAPMTSIFALPELGQEAIVYTHFAVSETNQQLFAFISKEDRALFRLLIKVSGVGPKMALALMSMSRDDIVRCVMEEELSTLVKVPGVGKKTAERLIIEIRDKLKAWDYQSSPEPLVNDAAPNRAQQKLALAEAESALVALGYKPVEAAKAVSKVAPEEGASAEALIRLALKSMLPA